ncbi:MAG: phosphoenolpyruvate carboxykinase (ATP), partial [Acidimicrobiales bacterium]
MSLSQQLEKQFGLTGVTLKSDLSQDELFHDAIANDRGWVDPNGNGDDQKAFATKLGVDGPLVYYTDPTCTGRPTKDTFAVARDSVKDEVWWKPDFQQFDPAKFDALLPRVIEHLNAKQATLYT